MMEYLHSNADLVAMMREYHRITGDLFWAKLDRKARTMTDEATGRTWPIPDEWNLT